MPPIPVYADKPLHGKDPMLQTDADADAAADAAVAPDEEHEQTSNPEPPIITQTIEPTRSIAQNQPSPLSPPPPQPGARPTPTKPVTITTASSNDDSPTTPPAPQPGGRPVARVMATHITTQTTRLPPQPPPPPPVPAQFSIPAPDESYLPTRSTRPVAAALPPAHQPRQQFAAPLAQVSPAERRGVGIDSVGNGSHGLEHPPNYVQSSYGGGGRGGADGMTGGGEERQQDESGVWRDVKAWAGGVGEKMAEAEAEAWKWVQNRS